MVKIIFHFFRQLRGTALQEMRNVSLDFIIKLITVSFHFGVEVGLTEEERCIKAKE